MTPPTGQAGSAPLGATIIPLGRRPSMAGHGGLTMTVSMPMVEVGALRVLSVDDGVGGVTPAQLFDAGGAPPGSDAGWERDEHRAFLDGEGRLEMPVGAFVVRTGDRTILVDAGYGPEPPATVDGGASLIAHLAAHGLAPHEITDVVLTHLHADHIGWTAIDGAPTFPRAV